MFIFLPGVECWGRGRRAVLRAPTAWSVRRPADDAAPTARTTPVVGGLPLERWDPVLDCSEEGFDTVFASNVRCAFRYKDDPENAARFVGVRPARALTK